MLVNLNGTSTDEKRGILSHVSGSNVLYTPEDIIPLNGKPLEKTIQTVGIGTLILLYEGAYKRWSLHPEGGVCVYINDVWYHNHQKTSEFMDVGTSPNHAKNMSLLSAKENKIVLGRSTVVYGGPYHEWAPNLKGGGIIIRLGHKFYLVVF